MYTDNERIRQLLLLGMPRSHRGWPDYISAHNLTDADIPDLIALVEDQSINDLPVENNAIWAPVHAWRALGQLKAVEAIQPLLGLMDYLTNDDYALAELSEALGMIGPEAIDPLVAYFQQEGKAEFSYVMAFDALTEIAKRYPDFREKIIGIFCSYMRRPMILNSIVNGMLIGRLLDLDARETIDDVRYLFSVASVDTMCAGDLEDVELAWELRTERSTPKQSYLERLIGKNSFADDYCFDDDEDPYPAKTLPIKKPLKIGRNEPCPCNSGKKYKKCCGGLIASKPKAPNQ